MAGALTRYRVMANIVGTFLVVLFFVGIPLQVWAHNTVVVAIVGTVHGFLYPVFLITGLDLSIRARFPLWKAALILVAGTVPFFSFVAERWVTTDIRARLAAHSDDAAAAPSGGASSSHAATDPAS